MVGFKIGMQRNPQQSSLLEIVYAQIENDGLHGSVYDAFHFSGGLFEYKKIVIIQESYARGRSQPSHHGAHDQIAVAHFRTRNLRFHDCFHRGCVVAHVRVGLLGLHGCSGPEDAGSLRPQNNHNRNAAQIGSVNRTDATRHGCCG